MLLLLLATTKNYNMVSSQKTDTEPMTYTWCQTAQYLSGHQCFCISNTK